MALNHDRRHTVCIQKARPSDAQLVNSESCSKPLVAPSGGWERLQSRNHGMYLTTAQRARNPTSAQAGCKEWPVAQAVIEGVSTFNGGIRLWYGGRLR